MKKTIKICLISTFLLFIAKGAWAMLEGEEQSSIPFTTTKTQQSKLKVVDPVDILPGDLLINISVFLEANDLGKLPQLSKKWKAAVDKPNLWEGFALIKYRDYLSQEDLTKNPKQKVIQHYLSVIANMRSEVEFRRLVNCYHLYSYFPIYRTCFKEEFLGYLIKNSLDTWSARLKENEFLVDRRNNSAIEKKIKALSEGEKLKLTPYRFKYNRTLTWDACGYELNPEAAKELCEQLVKAGNTRAIIRKLDGLIEGKYGYEKNLQAARELCDQLVETRNWVAIYRKLEGLTQGKYGYIQDLTTARELCDQLVVEGNSEAILRKSSCLLYGKDGYEKNIQAARMLNDQLVKEGNLTAISRKLSGLTNGEYGYEKNLSVAKELCDQLSKTGNTRAIETKLRWLTNGIRGGKPDLQAARELCDQLVEIRNSEAIEKKLKGLTNGENGYEKKPLAAREFIESLISKGFTEMIGYKFEALIRGGISYENGYSWIGAMPKPVYPSYGYMRDLVSAREFIEELTVSKFPHYRGIGNYIKVFALKYGITSLGYEKNEEKARELIRIFNVPY